ncbi:MAG TPA: glycoside hydrolase family 140 protein [Roseiflexaceae bacterium]|nr:glycoside hydrolase family 140 protein [Roseiflexaceae bacterium]
MTRSLAVHHGGRFLVRPEGTPFLYLGDTAWELFHRLTREEAEIYLRDRAAKGFSVIQAVVLAELDGLRIPNRYGAIPLQDLDPTRPVEAYFEHVDWIVHRANELGMFIGMLPTWGDKWNRRWGFGPEVFSPANAAVYGNWLGRRYRAADIIWILGGDRVPETAEQYAIIRAMAEGIRSGDGGRHLITFHPHGQRSSAMYFHHEAWLDFNMLQSGHTRDRDNYRSVAEDYARDPIKPCMDAEPGYENHPHAFRADTGRLEAVHVRRSAYWAMLAGGDGHTHGCHAILQKWQADPTPITFADTPWQQALGFAGATQMGHMRRLFESRPMLTRIPDQQLIASEIGEGAQHVCAARDEAGSYAFVYLPAGRPVAVDLARLAGSHYAVHWYDPRSGTWHAAGVLEQTGICTFTPPSAADADDWVLVLDQVAT